MQFAQRMSNERFKTSAAVLFFIILKTSEKTKEKADKPATYLYVYLLFLYGFLDVV